MYTALERGVLITKHVTISPTAASPVGKPDVLFADPRFAETPGWSLGLMPNGDIVYVQSPSENIGYYVRAVPNWVRDMKRAVDAANR